MGETTSASGVEMVAIAVGGWESGVLPSSSSTEPDERWRVAFSRAELYFFIEIAFHALESPS